ncbi:hypothetical protein ABT56_07405 [Photobacterium aquae]|uniref:Lipocalin-like domain-containing protein n=1 Tax=Photobacterium aquae TaxID=1195763 RepID=A0A0J1H5A9_9GAMM|nr:hypothetical protein [Photobacterium aquae]KLV06969.1 hypothetical protein ABT56_07405 [Photobacterium aquae]
MKIKKICSVALVLLLSACNSDDSGNNGSGNVIHKDLQGLWVSNCHSLTDENGNFISYVQDSFDFSGREYTQVMSSYDDQACTVALEKSDKWFGDYTIGDKVKTSDGKEAYHLTLNVSPESWPDWTGEVPGVKQQYIFNISSGEMVLGTPDNKELMYDIYYSKESK